MALCIVYITCSIVLMQLWIHLVKENCKELARGAISLFDPHIGNVFKKLTCTTILNNAFRLNIHIFYNLNKILRYT